jgi:plastocyanin
MWRLSGIAAVMGLVALAAACSSSGAGGREVRITQRDEGCDPASVQVTPGEKLKLVVKNESSKDYEIEGIEGTQLEEVVVPEGRTRTPGYTVPDGAGVHKLKCYVPGGPSTIIELVAGGTAATTAPTQASGAVQPTQGAASSQKQPDTTVAVGLASYTVTPDKTSVKAGTIRFIATNTSKDAVHELAVLKVNDDGSFENMGEIEDLGPEQGGTVMLDLKPGAYRLACLITKGESGSEVDHYQQGMYTDFRVE